MLTSYNLAHDSQKLAPRLRTKSTFTRAFDALWADAGFAKKIMLHLS
jgi:hypothetical protein